MADTPALPRDPTVGSQARLPTLGLLCLIAAAVGGGVSGYGFSFPVLTPPSRILLTALGFALILFEFRTEIGNWVNAHGARTVVVRIAVGIGVLAFVGLGTLVALRQVLVRDPPLQKIAGDLVPPKLCPSRGDTPSARDVEAAWIFIGIKARNDSDALDPERTIEEPCVPRRGETATIYREVHVWRGSDPSRLFNGSLAIKETQETFRPGDLVRVIGEISGPVVTNGHGQRLFYEVWAPVEKI